MTYERRKLLPETIQYYSRLEQDGVALFPQALAEYLLVSEDEECWSAALYMLATLPRNEIGSRFGNLRSAYAALAIFIASELSSMLVRRMSESETVSPRRLPEFSIAATWGVNKELEKMAAEKTRYVLSNIELDLSSDRIIKAPTKKLALLIHGTFAANQTWWRPHSPFWTYISQYWPCLYAGATPFTWTGGNNHVDRVYAATQLIGWVQRAGGPSVDLIAHSHGGNVCLEAVRQGLNVDRLILLGTPVRTEYMFDLSRIGRIFNVFSLGDYVQTPAGTFPHRRFEGRTFGDSLTLRNIRAEKDGKGGEPGHSELHEANTWMASNLVNILL